MVHRRNIEQNVVCPLTPVLQSQRWAFEKRSISPSCPFKMQSLVCVSQIFTTLLFNLLPAQTSHSPVEMHSEVMLFQEVWGRSLCHSMELLVKVEHEYPEGVEHIFSPACVLLWRCAGCCGDENLECHPTTMRNVTMQLMRITPAERTGKQVELTFVEHQSCECRLRMMDLNESSPRDRIRPRRKKLRKRAKDCRKCQQPLS
ncbi:snake venom vascular endothelial growth factor toxin ICPP [Esox lucius]|uniref:Platelet-derived growth factor (PDGF) family profile domain-containing protein n=1 Tax=Esox lucius TaxID=8010 RepID=A0A3P8Y7Z8_ESOLU|nr:snake venom vascular endothelial growth factor toxin ICPP [Esox lucius]